MVLFVTKVLLEGKSDLRRVWLAAHWHKKLKRSQIAQVDIVGSVRDMMAREIVLDLRLSGHLLLGIVRIFSRKTQLLLVECSDIFHRVRVFQGTELPASQLQARLRDITVTEAIFDPTFGRVDDEAIFLLNQSRIEEITLKETVGNPRLLNDDFDEVNFEEENIGPLFEDDLLIPLFNERDTPPTRKVSEQSVMNYKGGPDSPPADNPEDIEMEYRNGAIPSASGDSSSSDAITNRHASTSQELIFVEDEIPSPPRDKHELINLQPLSADVLCELRKRGHRKRKLIIDTCKTLSREDRMQSADEVTMALAPPTKRLMRLKEEGQACRILLRPGLHHPSQRLLQLFTRNLKTRKCEEESSFEEDSNNSFPSIEIPRQDVLLNGHSSSDEMLDVNEFPGGNFSEGMEFSEVQLDIESSCPNVHSTNLDYNEINFSNEIQLEVSTSENPSSQEKVVGFLKSLRGSFGDRSRVTFSELLKGNRKRVVARKFFSLLLLKKFCVVEVHQEDPFREITITRGHNYCTACTELLCP